MIGTPFISEDEITQRKVDKLNKKPWEQEVRDEKGRKRLHGAFTGGFSAGYFNTVGTKEGWTTTQFRSSRGDKITANLPGIKKKQDVMDFMDEEDIKDQIGDTAITSKATHKDYLSGLNPNINDKEDQEAFRSELNRDAISYKEFVPQFNNLIGAMLMRESGFGEAEFQLNFNANENKNDLTKNFFRNDFQNNIDDSSKISNFNNNKINKNAENNKYYQGKLEFKDDYFGAGYIPLIQDEIFISSKAKDGNAFGANNPNKNIIRMDKFEDDEDTGFFTNSGANDKQKYNFEILDENYLNEKEKELKKKRIRENMDTDLELSAQKFIKSENKLHSVENTEFKMPVLPKDYDPFAVEHLNQFSNKDTKNAYNIEAEINKLKQASNLNISNADGQQNAAANDEKEKLKFHGKLDANKRSEILDLELEIKQPKIPDSYNPYLQSKFTKAEVCDFKTVNDNKLIYNPNEGQALNNSNLNPNNSSNGNKQIKSAPTTLEQFNNYFHYRIEIPFKNDVSKIARFAKFIAEKEGLIMGDNGYNNKNNLMSASESKAERELFDSLYKQELLIRKQEQIKKTEIKNPQLSETELMKERIEKIKSREINREKIIWKPEKVLCKRFKVKDPFENKINSVIGSKGINNDVDRDGVNVTFKKGEVKYTMSSLQYQLFKQENPNVSLKSEGSGKVAIEAGKDIKSSNNENNVFKVINAKTDVNLFDEIFND